MAHSPERPFDIRLLDWTEAMPFARPVREAVFIDEQKVPRELEWDEWDEPSRHAIALDGSGRCIGTARLLPDGRLGRMAVLKSWRGQGVGSAMVLALLDWARTRGLAEVKLHAQTHAVPFYRRFGFAEQGAVFEEAGIPHVLMVRPLAPDPA